MHLATVLLPLTKCIRKAAYLPVCQWQSWAGGVAGDPGGLSRKSIFLGPHLYWISVSLSALGPVCGAASQMMPWNSCSLCKEGLGHPPAPLSTLNAEHAENPAELTSPKQPCALKYDCSHLKGTDEAGGEGGEQGTASPTSVAPSPQT